MIHTDAMVDCPKARPVHLFLRWRVLFVLLMFFTVLPTFGCSGPKLDQDPDKVEERRIEGQQMKMREMEDK